jgi:hypothetical protein
MSVLIKCIGSRAIIRLLLRINPFSLKAHDFFFVAFDFNAWLICFFKAKSFDFLCAIALGESD